MLYSFVLFATLAKQKRYVANEIGLLLDRNVICRTTYFPQYKVCLTYFPTFAKWNGVQKAQP